MKYTVGKYEFAPEKPFPSMEKAVQYVQGKYPELSDQTIKKFLNPKIPENGKDKSGNVFEESQTSASTDTEISATSVKGVKVRKD